MARLPYVTPAGAPDPQRVEVIYAEIRAMGRPVLHLYEVLANQPAALVAFLGMSRYVRDSSSLAPPVREMAILATAAELGQAYEVAHHRTAAVRAGVSPDRIEAVLAGRSDGLAPDEAAVVGYARQVAQVRDVDDATFERLRSLFSNPEITDLVLTVAWYHLCAAVLGPLHVELEA